MAIRYIYAAVICLLGCLPFSVALGCMYTVRDVGFVDIRPVPYFLYCYVRDDTPENLISTFKQISYAALMDSNVRVEIINVDRRKTPPDHEAGTAYNRAMKYLDFWALESFPTAILVSPEGQSLVLPLSVSDEPFKETVWSAVESIVISPKREEILSSIVTAYCVVLVIQGNDAAKNRNAQKAASDAIEELKNIMSQMPKSIEKPPRLIVISSDVFSQERIFLWSLGMSEFDEPHVALIYGRGRRVGTLMKGERITANGIFNVLSVIGSSCECGLDRGWMLGTMIPLRWDEKIQSEVVKYLGFDAESPMVKTEISQILSIGPSLGMDRPVEGNRLEEYSEAAVELETGQTAVMVSPAQFRQLVSPEPAIRSYRKVLFIISGIGLLIMAGGIFIVLRARRRSS